MAWALERICLDFYKDLYSHKDIVEEAVIEVTEGLPVTFTGVMNKTWEQEITEGELCSTTKAMAKGKAPGYDGIPVEFYQNFGQP